MSQRSPSVMFVAGDPSGDQHASRVLSFLSRNKPGLSCFGIGGPAMQREGFEALMPFAPFNRMGLSEVLSNLSFFAGARNRLAREMALRRPDLLVLVNYAGFNMRMMSAAKKIGIPVLWYIAPKVWAWKKGRARILGQSAKWIACILPFEPPYFEGYGARAVYVGNPSVEEMLAQGGALNGHVHEHGAPWRVALVPGSRPQEIARILPSMCEAGAILRERFGVALKVSRYGGLDHAAFASSLRDFHVEPFDGPLNELLGWCDFAVVTSGTATLQAALLEVPHVLVYKMSLTNQVAFKILGAPRIGLPNIIAGKEIVRECLQHQADRGPLADEASRFIQEPAHYLGSRRALAAIRAQLGEKRPSEQVGSLILDELAGR